MRTLRLGGTFCLIYLILMSALACACMAASDDSASKPYSAIGCIKKLPDGAYVYLNQKVITYLQGTIFYIEEPDKSAGIKVSLGTSYVPTSLSVGNLATVSGVMSTKNGERVILKGDVLQFDESTTIKLRPLGMSSPAIMGWPKNSKEPYGARINGLIPIGLFISIWGKPTRTSYDIYGKQYSYLDDGWGKYDASDTNAKGIRVYSYVEPDPADTIWCASGVLSNMVFDPTPNAPGDEVVIPCILTSNGSGLKQPTSYSIPQSFGTISGRVSLAGQSAPGQSVKIYSEGASVIVNNVTDGWTSFTLSSVIAGGAAVCASAPGYISSTRKVDIGSTNIDFVLQHSEKFLDISTDKAKVGLCGGDTATITGIIRDCEGKGLQGQQLRISTTAGIFTETGTNEIIGISAANGTLSCHLSAGSDGPGTATIKIDTNPTTTLTSETQVEFVAPVLSLSANQKVVDSSGISVVSATLASLGAGLPNKLLIFTTSSGTFVESGLASYTAFTDDTGSTQTTLQVPNSGGAIVVVKYVDNCSHETMNWIGIACLAQPWNSSNVTNSNPLVVDLDNEGNKEVVAVNNEGYLIVLNASGSQKWARGPYGVGYNTPSCAPMDAERSGNPCIFLPTDTKNVYAFSYDGNILAGWPTSTSFIFYGMACSIGDINRDGTPEIVSGDQCCYVWSWNPSGRWYGSEDTTISPLWINLTGTSQIAIRGSTCALGDMDNDENGILDVVVGTYSSPGDIYAFPGDLWGNYSSSGYYLTNWPKLGGNSIETAPAMGDIDGDGKNDVAWFAADGNLHIALSSTSNQVLCPIGSYTSSSMTSISYASSPALADLDSDGKLDVIVGSATGVVHAYNWLGEPISGWEEGIKISGADNDSIDASVVVGDVTGDGQVDVIAVCSDGLAYAIYADGVNHTENGIKTGPIGWVGCCRASTDSVELPNAPVIDDLDNDGLVEIVVAGSQGIYLFQTQTTYTGSPALYPWPTFHHDNRRSGCVTNPPAPVNASIQGIITHNGVPVSGASITIYKNDGTGVYVPHSSTMKRAQVFSVGSSSSDEAGKGAYCISQLDANQTYKLVIVATGYTTKTISNIAVGTGLVRVDVAL